ncbi:Malonyl CoA-acyl carrier protein transacylase, putative [Penicillium digitatum PHI26]|uniref:[acyl-carrier-protein] S-malonyltransferase n=3 Tax=Penicillium digitatum TaxID=36651 RepID=K9F876_PEND2|nr:Malonyl CoA-acyl carrier protein transacylase, putative [Penicillium digitatum Pd1]EKV05299.1 Malonyl CoA-acyl carrier protein transacylase, putative [Penicillium digitatum PHI26]EKV19847.1 Malonyl CoA-acyl carrier protein transacylase, putative [Penicillium digitatum Pd1]
MANTWIESFPYTAAKVLDEMDSTLGFKLSSIISDGPNSKLNKTENSQPAVMAISVLILRILEQELGFDTKSRVDVTLGHSLGEFSALVAGGYLEFGDALQIVHGRAEMMAQCTRQLTEQSGETYGMVALLCEPEHLESMLLTVQEFIGYKSPGFGIDRDNHAPSIQQVVVANINSKNQIVLSGSLDRIKTLLVQMRQFGGHDPRAVRLKSDSPFHIPAMALAADYMRDALEKINITFPTSMPCISNVTALPFQSKEDIKDLLSRQCTDTVRWWDSIRYLDQVRGVKRWIGIGPGKVGRNLVGKEVGRVDIKGGGVWAVCNPHEMSEIMVALEQTEVETENH